MALNSPTSDSNPRLDIVLVRTEFPENIGAAVRAAANMGGQRLILVAPDCELNNHARAMAAGAAPRLETLVSYSSWKEFHQREPAGLRLALTRRRGKNRSPRPLASVLQGLADEFGATGQPHFLLVFGPEADGLNTEEVEQCHYACTLPTFGEFASLNLAQAVLLTTYEIQRFWRAQAKLSQTPAADPSDSGASEVWAADEIEDVLKDWLMSIGFDWRKRRQSAFKVLRKVILRSMPSRHDIHILKSVFHQALRAKGSKPEPTRRPTSS